MASKNKKQKFPTAEEIEEKKETLLAKIEEKKNSSSSRSPSYSFLESIKDVVGKALEGELSFSKISEAIEETYGVKVQTNIISKFASKELDYVSKKARSNREREQL